jgi:UDP-glucose 4-epimerase
MKVLITGGAGFIGSTIASALLDHGDVPVILDSLVTGRESFTEGRIFYRGDVADGALIDRIFAEHADIEAAVHCAALIVVPESVSRPLRYYRENVGKTIDLLEHLERNGCRKVLFSSSAAMYKAGPDFTVDEDSELDPGSPYAATKTMVDRILADAAGGGSGLRVVSLRYFNPVGADPKMRTGLQLLHPSHALGKMVEAWEKGEVFQLTGTDWPTSDGTGIRDYIHVWDLAQAHVAALGRFDHLGGGPGRPAHEVINLGTGKGVTVRQLAEAFGAVTGTPLRTEDAPRRPGDVVGAYTRCDRSAELLDWRAKYELEDGIRHSLEWRRRLLDMAAAEASSRG